ncbi:hypothetical protein BMS3Bbin04_00079 [bacterium BMS3Bbin04]|nr:hypothetical protein BMS3Bbin04_00079 [bacterium BMS3Bbin04]
MRESVEELAVNILADRLVALHDNLRGWPLYYYSLTYEGSEGTVVINQNRPRGEFVVLDREKVLSNKTRETALKRLNLALPWLPPATIHPRLELKRIFFNQERTFYYVVPVSEAQASSVVYQSSEVMGVVSMTLHEFAALAEDPEYRTDTLSCLLRHNAFAKLQRLLSEL